MNENSKTAKCQTGITAKIRSRLYMNILFLISLMVAAIVTIIVKHL